MEAIIETPAPPPPDFSVIATNMLHARSDMLAIGDKVAGEKRIPTMEEAMKMAGANQYIVAHLPSFIQEFRRLYAKYVADAINDNLGSLSKSE